MNAHNLPPETVVKQEHCKDNHSYKTTQRVRALFLAGHKLTALNINQLCQTNDARKIISTLRNKEGWNIQDIRQANGCKLYWLASPESQMSLFNW